MKNPITALIADERGNIFDVPEFEAVGRVGARFKSGGTIFAPQLSDNSNVTAANQVKKVLVTADEKSDNGVDS